MTLLAIETSCDETSVAVVRDGCVLSNLVASQTRIHGDYGGVVPELATREHLKNLPGLARAAIDQSGLAIRDIDAIAATRGPGLPSALNVGVMTAESVAFALNKPFLGIHHHEAHLYSPWIHGQPPSADFESFQPNVALIVSGGHTLLVHVEAVGRHQVLGSTVDDAAGECFDKVARLMGLPYPGGPLLDQLAEEGNARAFEFPRPMLNSPGDDFSFSGLKTSVRYHLRDHPDTAATPAGLRDLAASVRAAIVDVLVHKTRNAALRLGVSCVTASGGVTCNRALRRELAEMCRESGLGLRLADPEFCTDNAAMIGVLAWAKLRSGHAPTGLDSGIDLGWKLT